METPPDMQCHQVSIATTATRCKNCARWVTYRNVANIEPVCPVRALLTIGTGTADDNDKTTGDEP